MSANRLKGLEVPSWYHKSPPPQKGFHRRLVRRLAKQVSALRCRTCAHQHDGLCGNPKSAFYQRERVGEYDWERACIVHQAEGEGRRLMKKSKKEKCEGVRLNIVGNMCLRRAFDIAKRGGLSLLVITSGECEVDQLIEEALRHNVKITVRPACLCGNIHDSSRPCTCSVEEVHAYQRTLYELEQSHDLAVEMTRPQANEVMENAVDRCGLPWEVTALEFMKQVIVKLGLGVPSVRRIMRLVGVLAKMDDSKEIKVQYVAEAVGYRLQQIIGV